MKIFTHPNLAQENVPGPEMIYSLSLWTSKELSTNRHRRGSTSNCPDLVLDFYNKHSLSASKRNEGHETRY